MLDNVAVAELTTSSRKASSLVDPFATDEGLDKDSFYNSIPAKKAEQLKDLELDTVQSVANDIKLKIKIGQNLLKAKKLLKHGEFLNWVKICFAWSERTANNQMQLAKAFEVNPNIAKFKPTVAYQLAQEKCPDEVLEQAIALIESGNEVTVNTVKELKETAKVSAIQPEVKPEIKLPAKTKPIIKKGDIVEWQHDYKGYTFGRVKFKSSDGLTCKIESLTVEPFSLGEKPTQFLQHCPIQKNNAENTIGNYSANYKIEPGYKVVAKPYTTQLQPFSGQVGIVIARFPEKRIFSVKIGERVQDFFWEELEHYEEPEEVLLYVVDVEATIDVDSVAVDEEQPTIILASPSSTHDAIKLFKETFEANVRGLLCSVNGDQFDYLLEKVLEHKDQREKMNTRYKWDE